MKKIKLLMVLGTLWEITAVMPVESDAAVSTVNVVKNYSSGLESADYTATLDDGTILGFQAYNDYAYFCGAITRKGEVVVPDSINVSDWSKNVAVKYIPNRCDFDKAESVESLVLPATMEGVSYLPSTVKVLHMNNMVSYVNSEQLSNLDKVFVAEEFLDTYLEDKNWRNYVLINAEGTEPLKITVDMTKAGEFAQLLLQQTDNWNKVNELVVVGDLNENDLNVFNRMKQLTKLDLSRAVIEDIPDSFDGATHYGRNRDGFNLLETLILPELNNIGKYAFSQCYSLKDITIPKVGSIGFGAFAQCGATYILLPEMLKDIEDYAFYESKLESITIPSTVMNLGQRCFAYSQLTSISLPESVKKIAYATFTKTGLTAIDLSNIQTVADYAFADCEELAVVRFGEGLKEIENSAFNNCKSLAEIDLPSTLVSVGYAPFGYCSSLKNVTSRSVIPPAHGNSNSIMYECDMTDVKLYVPAMSIDSYRAADGWKSFYTILPTEEKVENAYIYDYITADDASEFSAGCNITLDRKYQYRNGSSRYYYGALDFTGSEILSLHEYRQCHYLGSNSYNEHYTGEGVFTSLIPDGPMRADNVLSTFKVGATNIWYFVSLPYDVKVSDIGYPDGTQFTIRKYSGSNRARKTGDTWLNLTVDSIMHAYEGYILRCNKQDADFAFPSLNNANKNNVFEKESVVMPLGEYLSEFEHNRSWNLIGNPYPCYYDTRYMDFTAPITVWNRYYERYDAYSPIDDSYILHPSQAFFVQRPVGQASITFNREGRQKNATVRDMGEVSVRRNIPGVDTRKIFNVIISDDTMEDRTRFVINNSADSGYELDKDASKFIVEDNRSILVYTIENGVRYAINERPLLDGIVNLGFYAPYDGEYVLSLEALSFDDVVLSDNESDIKVAMTGDYHFSAGAGFNDTRFTLTLNGLAGIGNIIKDEEEIGGNVLDTVYATDGRLVGNYSADEIANLPKGIYIISGKGVKRKIVVK